MAWDPWPERLANGEIADAQDVLDALDLIKAQVQAVEQALAEGGFVTDDDPRLSDARDPKAHAASHTSGGPDALFASGTASVTTDGVGAATFTINHNLGSTPKWIGVTCLTNLTNQTTMAQVVSKNASQATIKVDTWAGGLPMQFEWIAVK